MIYIGLPDYDARISVLKASLRKSRVADDVSIEQIAAATDGYSGADLAEICQKAVQLSIREAVQSLNREMTVLEAERAKVEKTG